MDITVFLAQIWGPVMLAIAIGIFSSPSYYQKLYRDVGKDAFAGIIFGMAAMAAGIAQVLSHNVWNTLPEVVVSVLGWGLLLKGIAYSAAPKFVDRAAARWATVNLGWLAGGIMLGVGAYLTWFAYFS